MLGLPEYFYSDFLLAQHAYAHYALCVLAMGCFLQTDLSRQRAPRTVAGLFISAVLLVMQPYIYSSPTQTYGIGLASSAALCAWSLLHWTFIHNPNKKPSIRQVCMSVVTHPMSGVAKVYKRTQQQLAKAAAHAAATPVKASTGMQLRSGHPLVIVTAGDMQLDHASPPRPSLMLALLKSVATLLGFCICYDAGFYLLCALSNGMCSASNSSSAMITSQATSASAHVAAGLGVSTWVLHLAHSVLQIKFLAIFAFAYAAGSLLPLQMEVMYCCLRSGLFAGGFIWPRMAEYAYTLPSHAFNLTWPGVCKSVGELWGWRWHQFLRFYFEELGYTTMDKLLPKGKAVSPGLRWSMHTVAAFFMSGIMHEYLTWAAFGTVTGWYMAFFGLHCAAVLLETWGPLLLKLASHRVTQQQHTSKHSQDAGDCKASPVIKVNASARASSSSRKSPALMPVWAKRAWTLAVMVLLSPLFVEPYRAGGYFAERAFHPFGVPVTARVVGWAQQQLYSQLGFAEIVVGA